jgi:ATP adenylyltransferase
MQRIWAPWRGEYVAAAGKQAARRRACIFCSGLKDAERPGSLVVHVALLSFVMMNRFPYGSGHVMVAPRRHVGTLAAASEEELGEMMLLARRLERIFAKAYKPDGINLGMNLGKSAGAGVADHIHLHVLPRWNGDTNFMTVVGETRVIPEDPAKACARLRSLFER